MTKAQILKAIEENKKLVFENKYTCNKAEKELVKTFDEKLTIKKLEEINNAWLAMIARGEARKARQAENEAKAEEVKKQKEEEAKKPAPEPSKKLKKSKENKKPAWKMPIEFIRDNQKYIRIDTTTENVSRLSEENTNVCIGRHIEKAWFNKNNVYDSILSDEYNEKVMQSFPFVENVELYTVIASNDLMMVMQSLNTADFHRMTFEMILDEKYKEAIALYEVTDVPKEAPKKPARQKKTK